jgi:hypothetical protein
MRKILFSFLSVQSDFVLSLSLSRDVIIFIIDLLSASVQVVCVSVAGKVSGADLATTPGQPAVDRLAMKWAAPLADVEVVEGNS